MPIPLRTDLDAQRLRGAARESTDSGQTRRLLALAAIYDGASRTEAARIGGVTQPPLAHLPIPIRRAVRCRGMMPSWINSGRG